MSITEPTVEPLRARRRRLVQDEIERVAIQLFVDRGYEAVSVEDIAAELDMSARTFFRYYGTKDEILRRFRSSLGDALVAAFEAQPAGDPALSALRAAYASTSRVAAPDRDRIRALGRLLATAPQVHARAVGELVLDHRLVAEFARRSGSRSGDLRPAVVVAAVSAAAEVGWSRWVNGNDSRDPALAVTAAIDALGMDERPAATRAARARPGNASR